MKDYHESIDDLLSNLQTKYVNKVEASNPRYEAQRDLMFKNPIYLN